MVVWTHIPRAPRSATQSGRCLSRLPSAASAGRPRKHPLRTILDAIFYAVRAGHVWRLLPQEWPPWKTVYHYYRQWRLDGAGERIQTAVRAALGARAWARGGRDPPPRGDDRQPIGEDHRAGGPHMRRLWADQGYAGALRDGAREQTGSELGAAIPGGVSSNATAPKCLRTLASSKAFLRCHTAGSSNARLPGWGAIVG